MEELRRLSTSLRSAVLAACERPHTSTEGSEYESLLAESKIKFLDLECFQAGTSATAEQLQNELAIVREVLESEFLIANHTQSSKRLSTAWTELKDVYLHPLVLTLPLSPLQPVCTAIALLHMLACGQIETLLLTTHRIFAESDRAQPKFYGHALETLRHNDRSLVEYPSNRFREIIDGNIATVR